jgi:hypothetical protein
MLKNHALSFKDLKQRITIEQVLRHYNLFDGLHLKGKSHRGPCPICEAQEGSPFSVSLEKSCYQCFSCKASGNILDFVMIWEDVKVREAGEILASLFLKAPDAHRKPRAAPKPAEEAPPPANEAAPPVPVQVPGGAGERLDPMPSAETIAPDTAQGVPPSRNEPLSFGLKNIESDHPSVKALRIREDTLTSFGAGYYGGRGMMGNHIVIPIFNRDRQLLAYAGVHPEEFTYIFPPKFRRELELYNLACACAADGEDQGLILVRHPLEALMLIAEGYLNTVALMGETISEEQVALLLDTYGGEKITLFFPTHADVVPTLADLLPHFFVRLRRYEKREDTPLGFTAEEARELLA